MSAAPSRAPKGERNAGRYELLGELGRGGMAVVERVRDRSSGRELALKRLAVPADHPYAKDALRLFEREFHTLAQLAHPRIIEVYEYGIDEAPYYTMELLDGGDLRELSPLPWQQACRVAHDVCSSLALLHSRGLVHRDVSTRNIRCTRDGLAKLIDFGAMMPMGPCAQVVGTAPFVAPEVVNRSNVDARTDLFSLGATLYSALTGRTAYRARHFSELAEVWRTPPRPPSSVRAGIPRALDELVMSLLALDPGARPRSAAEVMARLAEIAGLPADESLDVRAAYLFAPALVGRGPALRRFDRHFVRARRGRGGGLAITGTPGAGRSRVLDACVLRAKVAGVSVLRCNVASAKSAPWAVAQALLDQLVESGEPIVFEHMPDALRKTPSVQPVALATDTVELSPARRMTRAPELSRTEIDARALSDALRDFMIAVARSKALVIAIDDLHRADEQSLALLCGLAAAAGNAPLLVVATLEQASTTAAQTALELFAEHAGAIKLGRLSEVESEGLLRGVFGDVPHIAGLNAAIYAVADGSPRGLLECAQHLVDSGVVHYESGSWRLPAEFDRNVLPSSIRSALSQRVARLSPLALHLGRCQALSMFDRFAHEDYLGLCTPEQQAALEAALEELVQQRVVATDGQVFSLAHAGWVDALSAQLSGDERQVLHRTLAELCVARDRHPLLAVRHLFDGGDVSGALDRLGEYLRALGDDIGRLHAHLPMTLPELAVLFDRAERASVASGRPPRELFDICNWVMMLSAVSDDALYWRAAPVLLARIEHDSGLSLYRELDPATPAADRIGIALGRAFERYTATPEAERVYRPDEAIKVLVYYAGVSIAIGTRTNDEPVLESLPALLEPFQALSPIVHTIWQNAIATVESTCRSQGERARARWLRVFEQLQTAAGVDASYVEIVGRAVAFALATCELRMGVPPSSRWLELLDTDILQCVSAAYLRRAWRIQLGDADGAERYRRQAELLMVHTGIRPLFTSHLPLELAAYASAYDYAGLREARQRIDLLAAANRGWVPYRALCDGYMARTRGNVERALAAFEQVLEQCAAARAQNRPRLNAWLLAITARIEALLELDRAQEGVDCGEAALARCAELEIELVADPLRRALALCEAKLGRHADGAARLDRVIADQTQLGALGVTVGASHEARARIAIWAGDGAAFENHAAATARLYRRGQGSALGARYERLIAEARQAGLDRAAPQQAAFSLPPSTIGTGEGFGMRLQIESAMSDAASRGDRALCALRLLCEASGAQEAYLFLFDGERLEHAATFGDQLAPQGLAEFLQRYLEAETEGTNAATVLGGQTQVQTAATHYEPGNGRVYRPIPLVTQSRGLADHAGIAALVLPDSRDRNTHSQLAGALAQYLIDTGDCTGARTARH